MNKRIVYYKDFSEMPAILTPEQCANILDLTDEQVRKLCRDGTLPAVKFGKVWRVSKDDLQEMFQMQEKKELGQKIKQLAEKFQTFSEVFGGLAEIKETEGVA